LTVQLGIKQLGVIFPAIASALAYFCCGKFHVPKEMKKLLEWMAARNWVVACNAPGYSTSTQYFGNVCLHGSWSDFLWPLS